MNEMEGPEQEDGPVIEQEDAKQEGGPVALVCGSCQLNVADASSAIELCSECDQLRCSNCASWIRLKSIGEKFPRFVCHQCRPSLVQKMEEKRQRREAQQRLMEASSPPRQSSSPGFLSKLLTSPTDEERVQKKKKQREEKMREMSRVWRDEIVPNWSRYAGSRKVADLCWEGIPPGLRKSVWPLLIGNRLSISEELFEIHGGRAFEVRKQASQDEDERSNPNKEQTVMLIPVDIGRTFPLLGFFQEEGPQHEELRHVLEAYVCLRPDIGYVQGMSFMAAVLLLNMDVYESFRCLANILNCKIFLEFFRMNMIQIKKYLLVLEELMGKHLPKIAAHLEEVRVTPDMFIIDWVLTLFSKSLPLDVAMRIWDCFFVEGTPFIFRTALGILKYGKDVLETGEFEDCLSWLTHLGRIDEKELFACIKSINLSGKKLQEHLGKYNLEM